MRVDLPFMPLTSLRMGHFVRQLELPIAKLGLASVKEPRVYDVSGYNIDSHGNYPDWSAVKPVPLGVISKASEWTREDPSFKTDWLGPAAQGSARAAYHFYHNQQLYYTSARQAKFFASVILKYGFGPNDYFVIDNEELDSKGNSMISATETVDFLYNVQVALSLPDPSQLMIYSTANLLNQLSLLKLTAAQQAWLKRIKIWTAGYPTNPDAFTTVPPAYTPDPNRYGTVVLWQYSPSGAIPGIPGATDLNWVDPAFAKVWTATPLPPPPPPAPGPSDIQITVKSDGPVALDTVLVDGKDETDVSQIHIVPLTPPTPPPPPVPASNLFDIKIRTVEWFDQPAPTPPAPGSFAIIGGRGQDNFIHCDAKLVKFIRSIKYPAMNVDNDALWNWASHPAGTVYIHSNADNSECDWVIGLMSSCLGQKRQYAAIDNFNKANAYQHVLGIPYQRSGDYSAWTPDKHPECWFFVPTVYPKSVKFPDGYLGWTSHNGLIFLMPFLQAGTGYQQSKSANEHGGMIATDVFLGPHTS